MSSILNESSEFLKHANQKLFEYFSKISSSTFRCLQHALYVILDSTNSTFPNKRTPLFQSRKSNISKHKNFTFITKKASRKRPLAHIIYNVQQSVQNRIFDPIVDTCEYLCWSCWYVQSKIIPNAGGCQVNFRRTKSKDSIPFWLNQCQKSRKTGLWEIFLNPWG